MFKNIIVRRPSKTIINGITSAAHLGKVDYEKAIIQQDNYIESMQKCGVEVEILPELESYPDSCFIEDVSVCTRKFAIITNPGADSRNGEIEGMEKVLSRYYNNIERIVSPGTLDGGDVMMVKDHYYIGLSDRTNRDGAEQFISILRNYKMSGSVVEMKEMLHLKTGLSYLENNILLITGEFINFDEFKKFDQIIVDEDEAYAANSIRVNDYVIVPKGYPKTLKKIKEKGLKTIEVDTSEYRKLDGGLSCLSLRF